MITERMTKTDITQYIGKHDIDRRLSKIVFSSDRVKKIQKNLKEYWRRQQGWPMIFKEPFKVTLEGNEYFCVLSVTGPKKGLDYNAYLRVYNERRYEYYTVPVGLGKDPGAICSRFSAHFVDRFQTRCPGCDPDLHFLVSYLKDQRSIAFPVPLDLKPGTEIWRTTKSGVILMTDWTYISYYRKLSDFPENRQESYDKYWKEHGQYLSEPNLRELLEFLEREEDVY